VRRFVREACRCPGVLRVALVGSLTTDKPVPKDADMLVLISDGTDLTPLARAGRRLKGRAQSINLGADIFLAGDGGRYIGRICRFRECHLRVACRAQHCGRRNHLNDDLHIVTLSSDLIAAPAVELWPQIIRHRDLPRDVEELLLARLGADVDGASAGA
jgi:hypothetical protein